MVTGVECLWYDCSSGQFPDGYWCGMSVVWLITTSIKGPGSALSSKENRFSRYDINAEGTLTPSITMMVKVKHLGYWICNVSLKIINSKIEICAL